MLSLVIGAAATFAAPAPSAGPLLHYTKGQRINYEVRGLVVANGQDADGVQLGDGLAYLNSTMVVECTGENETHYGFLMNMFETIVSNDGGAAWKTVSSGSLGDDTRFLQTKVGEVVEITYSTDDGQLVNNVKVGAINALHTHLVAAGETQTVTESSPVGTHASTMVGSVQEDRLHVAKSFDQAQIHLYADPAIQPGQLAFENRAFVQQHAEGWLHSASCHQDSLLMKASMDPSGSVRVGSPAAAAAGAAGTDDDETGGDGMQFSSTLHSRGTFNLTFLPTPPLAAVQHQMGRKRRTATKPVSTSLLGYARSQILAAAAAAAPAAETAAAAAAGAPAAPVSLKDLPSNHDFPFNKSYSTHARIGPDGKHNWDTLYANYSADMFIGTNFDCHQPTFNYEAEAHVESWVDVFGTSKQAFYAQFIYGADNGMQLPDQAVVNVWGKQVYQKDLKAVDCSPHTVPVAHSDPGFDKSFTIWSSFIPVTLHITTKLDLDLTYTWSICDTDLTASVQLNPKATLTVTGSAAVNLLVVDTTTALEASFSQALVPTLALKGSECKVDFTVERKSDPMTAKFHSFYKYKKCKFLCFDCHWSDQYDKEWWSWEHPAEDVVEYTHTYNISL